MSQKLKSQEIDAIGKYAALLSITEVGLGSLLHAWHIPFSGQCLSLNQGFISAKAVQSVKTHSPWTPFRIAMIAALLKSFSPAGKRLTPMLAISVQGFLYSCGQVVFGPGYLGGLISILLLSLWAFIQPVLIYLLVFGRSILDVGDYFFRKIQEVAPVTYDHLLIAFGALVLSKLVLAAVVNHLAFFKRTDAVEKYFQRLIRGYKKVKPQKLPHHRTLTQWQKIKLVFKDMSRPWFVISIALMGLFFHLTQPDSVRMLWFLMRPIAVGFVVFYALRFLPVNAWLKKLVGNKSTTTGKILNRALAYMDD